MPPEAIPAPVASQNWKNMNESDKEQIEWGYVWMEHCRLCFVDGESGNTGGNVALKEWIDVDVLYDDDYDEMKLSHTNRTGRQRPLEDLPEVKGDIDDSLSAKFCSRCNLVLYQSGPMGSNLKVRLNEIPPCQGTTKDFLGTDECSCIVSRSDACLIMGVMRTCASVARVQHCSILRESDSQEPTFTLVISVAFPHLLHGPGGRRNIMALKDYRRAYKPLHTTTQLILSILRSDWKNLISMMEKMRLAPTIKVENRRVPRFFPNRLGLDELYERIQGTAATHMMLETRREDQLRNQRNDCLIVQLPKDVFTDYLAPFLKPRSLDALRCSCSYLHNTLRAVVPGLKLRLYSHQVSSLIWMRNRETNLLSEKDCLSTTPLPDSPDRDLHRMVTGGYTTLLRSRCPLSDLSIRIDQKTGFEIVPKDLTTLPRTVARGGLLCDDPGLGKTVTVLSLIMQTAGLSTKANDTVDTSVSKQLMPMEEAIFRTYWNEQMTPEFRRPLLHRFLNAFVRQSSGGFIGQADQVKRNIDLDKYDLNFSLFERDMTEAIFPQTWEGKHEDNDSDTHVYRNAARQLKSEFLANVEEFKQTQLQSARKSFSSVSAKPNSRVAALLDRSEQMKFVDSLVSSSATLLVVPAVLLDHWQAQIDLNLDLSYCTDKIPLIFEFGRKHKGLTMEAVCAICKDNGSHFPMVFIDRGGTKKLPAPEFLAMFQIVITTTQRFSQEWRNGSFQAELRSSGCKEGSKLYLDSAFDRSESACPLLKIHWLRMIVDEGHSMAKNQNSTIQFASWISAERRWAMTGTPTKQSATQIQQIYAMLRFLGHGFFTPRLDGNAVWTSNVARCWKEGSFAAFFRLRSLLGLLMKRHTKRDIAELELPCCSAELIPMSFVEVTTYNTLVCGVQSNILLTSMSGKTSGLQDSLLHRSQVRHARAALSNLRRVCVGYSRVLPTLETRFYIETMVLLKEHGRDDRQIQNVKEYLHRAEAQELSECDCCQIKLSTLLLFPCCGGFLCPECMDEKSNICVLCDQDFDVDEFQRLQPGFSLKWLETMIESERRKPKPSISNANVQVDPPGGGDPIMRAEIELPNGVLVRPNMELRRTRRLGDGHECQYDRYTVHGKCILCLSEHSSCNLFNDNARCAICFRAAEECSEEESKSFYLVKKLSELHQQLRNNEQRRPLKIIVFSQFRQALNMAGNRLLRKFGTACIAEYWGSFRTTELRKFTYDRDCFCMLLGRDGSEGLDLSFVTHIFFLEEIMDQSLRDQAIARAWRMGAKGRVRVVTLTAAKTVEETMQEIESAAQYRFQYSHQTVTRPIVAAAESNNLEEYATAKTHALLRSLRLITDYHHFSAEPRTSTAEKATCLNNKIPGISKESDKTVDNPPVKRRKVTFT